MANITLRNGAALMFVPVMKLTGFRFSKEYRHAEFGWKAFVYRHVATVKANIWAEGGRW